MKANLSQTGVSEASLPGVSGPLRRALQAHGAGRLGEAEFYCQLVLAADKKQFDALHLLGLIKFQRGQIDEAHRLIRQAVRINPRSVHAHSNLGLVFEEMGNHEQALACLRKALAIEPDNLLALNNHGHVLWRLKRLEEALQSLDRAMAIKPNYADALCNRGNVMVDLQRFQEALADYDAALAINSKDAPALNNRANVLWALDRRDEALQSYDRAAALDPNDLSILKDRGSALIFVDRGEDALACFDHALALQPDNVYFLYKRGSALAKLDRYEEALDCFDQALAVRPDDAEALDNRGTALAALQRAAEAIACFDRALEIAPESPTAHWNRGLTLLGLGNFEEGWKEYEWRWKIPQWKLLLRDLQRPLWLGEHAIEGKTILLHAEQGFGDCLQFLRYVPMVAARGAKVIVEVLPELKSLVSSIAGASLVLGRGETLPQFDLQCPLMSLPLAFKTQLETIPAKTPYLSVAPERVSAWTDRLGKSQSPRIAVAWAGNTTFTGDKTRSVTLPRLAPLLSAPGFQFFSLQKELRAGDEQILRENPQIIHLGDQLTDFHDTAAIMSLVDLVISSDTSVVHLAGALNRPVWILLEHMPEWRWSAARDHSPWYPSAKLFRQTSAGDWNGVVEAVAAALKLGKSAQKQQPTATVCG
jgi:tetratricopeptide (TPR) repeat protein